ncbi:unnamed protein product [Urochloa humidicola]
MEGAGVAARPGLVAASGIGSLVGASSATAGRQRKPGRWKRIPRYTPTTGPMPTANPMTSPKVVPPPGTTDSRPFLPSFRSFAPAGEPRESGEARQQLPFFESFEGVVLRKGSKEAKEREELCNQRLLEQVKQLEEQGEDDLCDTEEDKVAFRAFKTKFVSFYRKLAITRAEDVVFNYEPPTDTPITYLRKNEHPMEVAGVASRPCLVAVSGTGGSSTAARQRKPGRWKRIPRYTPTPPLRLEKPIISMTALPPQGKMHCAPFLVPGFQAYPPAREPRETGEHLPSNTLKVTVLQRGSKEDQEMEERQRQLWEEEAKRLEEDDEDLCDTEEAKVAFRAFKTKFVTFYRKLAARRPEDVVFNYKPPPSDTPEEHLTAEEMEMEAGRSSWPVCPQAEHFATLALDHYNSKKMHKFEMARVLLSKCFSEVDGTTFAHVNFTATTPQPSASHPAKRLFFAELKLIPDLQADESAEPMRVLNVCTIDDSCFGGCHEIVRDIKGPVSNDLDYDRCHACSKRIKHPKGSQFIGGHNSTRMPYFSVFPNESG